MPGVYALRGWGIAHSFAIEAPGGWIIVDTGDSTRAATEMREKLEAKVGKKIKVAAILLTHWHDADGTAAWLDTGARAIWGREHLDRNRRASTGVNVLAGTHMSRAIAQFGVLHPPSGPDAFPNLLGFTPEKFVAVSSYQPPAKLFEDGKVVDLVIAGEPVQVAPNRWDASDSVGFWFPRRRLLVTNFMVVPTIFNIYTLRGSPFRNPVTFIQDARWLESKNADVLLDIHGPDLKGEKAVREALEMSVDQVRAASTTRPCASSPGAWTGGRRPRTSTCRPTCATIARATDRSKATSGRSTTETSAGSVGTSTEINPLSLREEAARSVGMMGRARSGAEGRRGRGPEGRGLANWRWSLKLTSLLLRVDPADASARKTRATAAPRLGQRTDSANARGFYITEALTLEGRMMADGRPVTLDEIRVFVGTPRVEQSGGGLGGGEPGIRPLPGEDPRKAEGERQAFTIAAEGDPQIRRVELRNGVLVITEAGAKAAPHVDVTRRELADFVLGKRSPPKAGDPLTELDRSLDRSHLLSAAARPPATLEPRTRRSTPTFWISDATSVPSDHASWAPMMPRPRAVVGQDFGDGVSTAPCRRAPESGIDDVRPWLVYRPRPRLDGATARNPGAPPRRPVVTERASGRAPAARSHTPNHYVGLWDRVAVTR